MKYTLNILLLFFLFQSTAQNLVPNPSFENGNLPYSISGLEQYCDDWTNLSGLSGATPDYWHANANSSSGAQLPNCMAATVYPFDGNAIAGFIPVEGQIYREYISAQLISPLIIGETYKVSFSITNGIGNRWRGSSCDHIGIMFTTSQLFQSNYEPIYGTPQVEVLGEIWEPTWKRQEFEFTPDSSYLHLTIGNFAIYNSISITLRDPSAMYYNIPYYFIDSVVVEPMETSTINEIISHKSKTLIKIIDSTGRESEDNPNTILFFIYNDGTIEKRFRIP